MDARAARVERADRAQRWISIIASLAVIFLIGWMTLEAMNPPHGVKKDVGDASVITAAAHASGSPSSTLVPAQTESDASVVALAADDGGGLFLPSISLGDAGGGIMMPSGAPRHVKIGVVLVSYQGAEGASATARSKRDALSIAERLVQEAKTDFHHAVTGGDTGSSDDIGRLPRGVLDPRTEATVFALSAGEVSDVLETPRGYWIVKRVE